MNEFTPQERAVLDRLQESMVDPYIDRMTYRGREYETAVNETEASRDERRELAAELNKEWIYFGKPLIVTGDVWTITPESTEPVKISVTDMKVISDGFMFDADRLEFEGEQIEGLQRISYALIMNHTGRTDGLPVYGALHFDDAKHIEYPFASPDLREQRFRYHYEQQADEIDSAYLAAIDDGDMIRRLRDFGLDVNMSDPDDVQAIADGQEYLNRILNFDTTLPYIATILGQIVVFTGEEKIRTAHTVTADAHLAKVTKPFKRFVTINRVLLHPADLTKNTSQGTHRFVPYIECLADSKNKADVRQKLLVPFASVLRAESIRDIL